MSAPQFNALISDATLDASTATRTPASHAASHLSAGGDSIKLDDLAAPEDNTDLNATTLLHGLLLKLGGGTTNFLRADGTWNAPSAPTPVVICLHNSSALTIQGTLVDIPWNSERIKTTGFTHSTTVDNEEITITDAGIYRIDFNVTTFVTSGTSRADTVASLRIANGGGYSFVGGTYCTMYNRTVITGTSTGSVSIIREFDAGDKLKVQVVRLSGASTMGLYAGGSRISIQKI